MGYDDFILTVNSSSIIILLGMAAVLLAATRFRGESGYAAAIIVLPNVPVYIYNMSRMLEWHNLTLFMFPISYSVNTLLMPLLWLFAKKNFDLNFRLKPIHLLHLLPGLLCLGLSLAIPTQERIASIQHEMTGDDTWIGVIFRFLHRKKRAIRDTASDAEWVQKEWIPVFEYLFAALFVIVMVCYFIWPRTDAWLIQILNVVAMFYLVYNSIAHPVVPIKQVPENIPEPTEPYEPETSATPAMDDSDISLAIFAKEINIPQRTLSRSINGCLGCNFFEFINRMRVEEAKRLLLQLDVKDYNIDSIYTDCGFRSRSTFFLVFKKVTGKSPVAWLRER